MFREFTSVLGGIGLLIFAYLLLSHSSQASTIAQGLTAGGVDTISVLQGQSAGSTVQFPT
jgi:hypothetical protein